MFFPGPVTTAELRYDIALNNEYVMASHRTSSEAAAHVYKTASLGAGDTDVECILRCYADGFYACNGILFDDVSDKCHLTVEDNNQDPEIATTADLAGLEWRVKRRNARSIDGDKRSSSYDHSFVSDKLGVVLGGHNGDWLTLSTGVHAIFDYDHACDDGAIPDPVASGDLTSYAAPMAYASNHLVLEFC